MRSAGAGVLSGSRSGGISFSRDEVSMKLLRRLVAALLVTLALGTAGTAAFFWHEGYRVFAVRSGSMAPTYLPGDLVIDEPAPTTYAVGDVITFASFGGFAEVTTHRVVDVDERLRTKGDANTVVDTAQVDISRVVGRVVGAIPDAGYVLVFFKQPAGVAGAMSGALTLVFLWRLCFPTSMAPRQPDGRRRAGGRTAPSAA
jgi:signal peptidase